MARLREIARRAAGSYILMRTAVAGAMFCSLFLGAQVIDPQTFSKILLTAFLAKFLMIGNFGATNGYFVSRFKRVGPLAHDSEQAELAFAQTFLLHLLLIAVAGVAISYLWFPEYTVGFFLFIFFAALCSFEPIFRYRSNFLFSLKGDISLALALIGTVVLSYAGVKNQGLFEAYVFMVIAIISLLITKPVASLYREKHKIRPPHLMRLSDHLEIIKMGFPVFLGTAFYSIAISIDRLLLPSFASPADQASYFFAFQLASGSALFIQASGFVAGVEIGHIYKEKKSNLSAQIKSKIVKGAGIVTANLLLFFGLLSLYVAFLNPEYPNLFEMSICLAVGLNIFFLAGMVTPVLAIMRKQAKMTILLGFLAGAVVTHSVYAIYQDAPPIQLALALAVALSSYSAIAIIYTWTCVTGLRTAAGEGNE